MKKKTHHSVSGGWDDLLFFLLIVACMWMVALMCFGSTFKMHGAALAAFILDVFGAAVFVPLLFMLYVFIVKFFHMIVPMFWKQLLGTIILYFTTAATLAMTKAAWPSAMRFLDAGAWGRSFATLLTDSVGTLLTLLLLFIGVLVSSAFFGLPIVRYVFQNPVTAIAAFMRRRKILKEEFAKAQAKAMKERERELRRIEKEERRKAKQLAGIIVANSGAAEPRRPIVPDFDENDLLASSKANLTAEPVDRGPEERGSEEPHENATGVRPGGKWFAPTPEYGSEPPTDGMAKLEEILKASLSTLADDAPIIEAYMEHHNADAERPSEPDAKRPSVSDAEHLSELDAKRPSEPDAERPSESAAKRHSELDAAPLSLPIVEVVSPRDAAFPVIPEMNEPKRAAEVEIIPPADERRYEPQPPVETQTHTQPQQQTHTQVQPQPQPQPQALPAADVDHLVPDPTGLEEEADVAHLHVYFPPPIDIFGPAVEQFDMTEIRHNASIQGEKITTTLQEFGVKADVAEIVIGPSVIQFQLQLAPGIRVNKVAGLSNDLAMALAVISVRVEAPIPGKPYVGIEIPNTKRRGIPLRSVIESDEFQESKNVLPLPMGMRVDSRFMVTGLEEMPHLLVAGTTGSGKSVFTNTCIMGMCTRRTPDELKLILVDPKHVEFAIYEGLPHLLAKPISDPKKAVSALSWAVQQMEARSEMFARAKVRNLESYNQKVLPKDKLPYIVIVVDELADLMYSSGKEVESYIARLAQKARSAGLHMILATQRPSVDVITGLIKANVPARVAFAVPSQTDSRTIIDTGGADKLLGKGDMLFLSTRFPRPVRLQASFINEDRTLAFIECLKRSFGAPEYIEFEDAKDGDGNGGGGAGSGITLDSKINEAVEFIMDTGIASASRLQTVMGIGYPRASRIISTLEQLGILGPQPSNPSKPREILVSPDEAQDIVDSNR